MSKNEGEEVQIRTLLLFFLPLGTAASLVTISHVIINSTLGRADNAEFIIACYAIAMSVFVFTERTAVLLRQTCSALVKDKLSFQKMFTVTIYMILFLLSISFCIAFTPFGNWLIASAFGVTEKMVYHIKEIYQVLIFVTIFSALRCLYQGIIISNRKTKWLTIGMGIRLIMMYLASLYFISTGQITGKTGAVIFLIGMAIECGISIWEGRLIRNSLPEVEEGHPIRTKKQIITFYYPLVLSTMFIVVIAPFINAFLGKLEGMELAIASFAIAFSLVNLVNSFFSYIHQIVLNFFHIDARKVIRFSFVLGVLPAVILTTFCFSPLGFWFMEQIMGLNERLIVASIAVLKIFIIFSLVFPYLDFFNGLLMLLRQTRFMMVSQFLNLITTVLILILGLVYLPHWNGQIGALAQSVGLFLELIIVVLFFSRMKRSEAQQVKKQQKAYQQ